MKIRGWYVAEYDLLTTAHFAFQKRFPIREGESLTLSECVIPRVCEVGYHASPRLLDALGYRDEGRITLVEVFGDVSVGDDKVAGRSRRTLRIVPKDIADRECRLFAADVAERLLEAERKAGREPSPEAFAAVEIARRFALGDADETDLDEARQAARMAALASAGTATRAAVAAQSLLVETVVQEVAWAAVHAASITASRGAVDVAQAAVQVEALTRIVTGTRLARRLRELENRLLRAIGEES